MLLLFDVMNPVQSDWLLLSTVGVCSLNVFTSKGTGV